MTPPLAVLFAQHKAAFLGAGAAGVAGLALLQRKKATAGSAPKQPAGTIPAAAVVPAGGVQGGYPDTSATDMYNQLEGQLERLQASQAVPVPSPVASSLFAPTGSGSYVAYSDGIYERESDNSLFHLSGPEWQSIITGSGGQVPVVTNLPGAAPGTQYASNSNLSAKIGQAAGVKS